MRGSRPRKPSHHRPQQDNAPAAESTPGSAGNALRDALARNRADADAQEQQRVNAAQSAQEQSLSKFFNDVAADLPAKIQSITKALQSGGRVATDFSYSASDMGVQLRGSEGVQLDTLAGFKKLDAACKSLDVECTVTAGKYGYGRKSTAGQSYLHVSVDAAQPYRPVTVDRPLPPGSRRR